jgi:hypothetical protein
MSGILLSTQFLSANDEISRGSITIDAKILSIIDGMQLGNSSVHKAHVFSGKIKEMLHGKKDRRSGTLVGVLKFKNNPITIKELVEIEHLHGNDEDYRPHIQASFKEALRTFEDMSDAHLKEVKGTKEMTMPLIHQWSVQRNLPETLLLEWSKVEEGHEQEHFRQAITSFTLFDGFLEDLKTFLNDFMHSCPKSLQNYVAMIKSREKK